MLVVGCGDVGLRFARGLPRGVRVMALTSTPARVAPLREQGIAPLVGNLDRPSTLARLAGIADHVVHLAPPSSEEAVRWWQDMRTQSLLRALRLRTPPRTLVYASTSGVFAAGCG